MTVTDDEDCRALAHTGPTFTTLEGAAGAFDQLLTAPASGVPCVHWRLRITEYVAPGLELVHEVCSPEPIEIAWQRDPGAPATRLRLPVEATRIEGQPLLFRDGSPGARAVAERFGLRGSLRVEELVVHQGQALRAEGFLDDPGMSSRRGPYRTIETPTELVEATIRLGNGPLALRPIILPWALGTAAALFGAFSAVTAVARWYEGQATSTVRPFGWVSTPAEIGPARAPRPRWP